MPSSVKTPKKRGRPPKSESKINTSLPSLSSSSGPAKKRGRPPKSSSPKQDNKASSSKQKSSPSPTTKRPRGRPPKSKEDNNSAPASFFDPRLPPPPPPPPPVNNPFYQNFVKDYWQKFYFYNQQSASVMTIPGIGNLKMPPAGDVPVDADNNLDSKPAAVAAAAAGAKRDEVESTCV